jgi:LysM repeat protein
VFVVGSLLPPYVPKAAPLQDEEGPAVASQYLLVEDGFIMKSSTLGSQGARLAYGEGIVHVVKPGESLESLKERYGIKVQTIQWVNNLKPGVKIQPGQELLILPVDGVIHSVKPGQTLVRIAQLYGVPAEDIARQNGIEGGFILAGQQLIIPGGKPLSAAQTVLAATDPSLHFVTNLPKDIALKVKSKAELARVSANTPVTVIGGGFHMPCGDCYYTQYYHPGHYGVDIQTRGGGPIYAAEAGTVTEAAYGWNGGYGNVIQIDHGNGLITLYGHNKELYVKVGDHVTKGQTISYMGNTGRVYGKTGIHVHFEVILNGVKKNPVQYLR